MMLTWVDLLIAKRTWRSNNSNNLIIESIYIIVEVIEKYFQEIVAVVMMKWMKVAALKNEKKYWVKNNLKLI